MKRFTKSILVVALGLATSAAFAGEIENTIVDGSYTNNFAQGDNAHALQRIGVAAYNGKIKDSQIYAGGADNRANGRNAQAQQDIGVAQDGRIRNTTVMAWSAQNRALGEDSVAVQEIGKAKGSASTLDYVTVYGMGASNQANARAKAEQKIGVAE